MGWATGNASICRDKTIFILQTEALPMTHPVCFFYLVNAKSIKIFLHINKIVLTFPNYYYKKILHNKSCNNGKIQEIITFSFTRSCALLSTGFGSSEIIIATLTTPVGKFCTLLVFFIEEVPLELTLTRSFVFLLLTRICMKVNRLIAILIYINFKCLPAPLSLTQRPKHSSLVSNLLLLPRHPPYINWAQFFMLLS